MKTYPLVAFYSVLNKSPVSKLCFAGDFCFLMKLAYTIDNFFIAFFISLPTFVCNRRWVYL